MIGKLQIIATTDRVINQIQTNVSKVVNPLTTVPLNSGFILESIPLTTGANSVNHLLGRALVGWFIVRQRSAATVYDTQDTNPTPTLTLNLVSSADVSVDIFVF
jgi:hypothetical protein